MKIYQKNFEMAEVRELLIALGEEEAGKINNLPEAALKVRVAKLNSMIEVGENIPDAFWEYYNALGKDPLSFKTVGSKAKESLWPKIILVLLLILALLPLGFKFGSGVVKWYGRLFDNSKSSQNVSQTNIGDAGQNQLSTSIPAQEIDIKKSVNDSDLRLKRLGELTAEEFYEEMTTHGVLKNAVTSRDDKPKFAASLTPSLEDIKMVRRAVDSNDWKTPQNLNWYEVAQLASAINNHKEGEHNLILIVSQSHIDSMTENNPNQKGIFVFADDGSGRVWFTAETRDTLYNILTK